MTDSQLIAALGEVAEKGVHVDVMITKGMFISEDETGGDEISLESLGKLGLNVHQSPDFYEQAHNKMILVDDSYALIGTGNMGKGSFDEIGESKAQRDFWVTVEDENQVNELRDVFAADFKGERTDLKNAHLVWGPDQGRTPFINLIGSAKHNLSIYQADIQDAEIAHAIEGAAQKGIKVRLMMPPFPYSKTKDANIPNQEMIRSAKGEVGLITHVVGHTKVVLVDVGTELAQAWVGSTNFYPPSLDKNRELGIITSNLPVIDKISSVFEYDWGQANFEPREIESTH